MGGEPSFFRNRFSGRFPMRFAELAPNVAGEVAPARTPVQSTGRHTRSDNPFAPFTPIRPQRPTVDPLGAHPGFSPTRPVNFKLPMQPVSPGPVAEGPGGNMVDSVRQNKPTSSVGFNPLKNPLITNRRL